LGDCSVGVKGIKIMNHEVTEEKCRSAVEEAERLIQALEIIIEELQMASILGEHLSSKRKQLADLSRMINTWEANRMAVPAELHTLKERLERDFSSQALVEQSLTQIKQKLNCTIAKVARPGCAPQDNDLSKKQRVKGPSGLTTPQEEYWPHIIEVLKINGGRAQVLEIRAWIEKNMSHLFRPRDLERLKNGELVWWKIARRGRVKMLQEGILKRNTVKGMWELNE